MKVIVKATSVDFLGTVIITRGVVDDLSPRTWLIHVRIFLLSHSVLTFNFLYLALGLDLRWPLLWLLSCLLLFLKFFVLWRHLVVFAGVTCSCLFMNFLNDGGILVAKVIVVGFAGNRSCLFGGAARRC